ncbi:MAG: GntR family transcriptional regulator [Rhodospirillales bacterium]|nr:GntR family transcriptional regulator [Rhodospirillales bacterium]
MRLTYPPGSPIFENALATKFGVSRTPMRDVLKRLSHEGLVEIRPGHGTFVTLIDVARLRQAVLIRSLLETEAAGTAAAMPQATVLANELAHTVDRQRLALAARRLDDVYVLDELFHRDIFLAAGLPMMWDAVHVARGEMDRIHHIATTDTAVPEMAIQAHARIVEAIASKNPEAARAAMLTHVQWNLAYLTNIARSNPDYLKDSAR